VSRYRQRVSGPLLDRFDLVVKVDRLEAVAATGPSPEASKAVRSRVTAARQVLAGGPMAVGTAAENLLIGALETALLTARGVDRVRRVAVTIAALESAPGVAEDHVAEALALRADW
jgi:magnesium chelatase family protein